MQGVYSISRGITLSSTQRIIFLFLFLLFLLNTVLMGVNLHFSTSKRKIMAPRAKDYFKSFPNDITASVVVFLVALPLCLGIALASGAPLFSGLIAGIIGGIVVGIASKSHLSVSGPAAGLTAIVATALFTLPSFEAFLLAVVLAGVMQIALGFAKAGVIGDFVPNSVIKGMLAAIGIILILNQFPHLLGDDSQFVKDESVKQDDDGNIFANFFQSFLHITPAALFIGLTCLVFIFYGRN